MKKVYITQLFIENYKKGHMTNNMQLNIIYHTIKTNSLLQRFGSGAGFYGRVRFRV